jgi:hypothetical protein
MFVGNLIAIFYALTGLATPSGVYVGSKTVFGETIGASVSFRDSNTLDFAITGAFALNCAGEPYVVSGNEIVLSDIDQVGDCAHDALEDNGVILTNILYDGSKNHLTVSVKYSVAKIDLELSPELNFMVDVYTY